MAKKAVAVMHWLTVSPHHLNMLLIQEKREMGVPQQDQFLLGIPVIAIIDQEATGTQMREATHEAFQLHMSSVHPDLIEMEPIRETTSSVFMRLEEQDEWVSAFYAIHPPHHRILCLFPEQLTPEQAMPLIAEKISERFSGENIPDPTQWRIYAYCSVQLPKRLVADERLKEAEYPCLGAGYQDMPLHNKVAYAIIDNWVVFSGLESERSTSTINAAESIVQAIADQEGIDIVSYRWFDLQTRRGYGSYYYRESGQFDFQELELTINPRGERPPSISHGEIEGQAFTVIDSAGRKDFTVVAWIDVPCPEHIRDLFKECIFYETE